MFENFKEIIHNQYKSEQKRYKLFVPMLRYFGFSMLILYLVLLFSIKGLDPKYFLLNVYAIYCNSSVLILFQYYKVPKLFENLFSEDISLVNQSYLIINENRNQIYKSFLIELLGQNYTEEQLNYDLPEIKDLILKQERLNWNKIGKIYFGVFFTLSVLLFYYLLPADN